MDRCWGVHTLLCHGDLGAVRPTVQGDPIQKGVCTSGGAYHPMHARAHVRVCKSCIRRNRTQEPRIRRRKARREVD